MLNQNKHQTDDHYFQTFTNADISEKNLTIRPKVNINRLLHPPNGTTSFYKFSLQGKQSKNTFYNPTLTCSTLPNQKERQKLIGYCNLSESEIYSWFINQNLSAKEKFQAKKVKKMYDLTNLMIQIKQLKQMIEKQVRQKVIEMHKIYSEGNKKSIQLVLMIVKQLEKENYSLRQKLKTLKKQNVENRSSLQNKNQEQSKIIEHKQTEKLQLHQVSPLNNIQAIEARLDPRHITQDTKLSESTQQQEQTLSPIQQVQGHVHSILIMGQHLETIHEMENDDDEDSINKSSTSLMMEENTFSAKTYKNKKQVSLFVSSFNEDLSLNQNSLTEQSHEECSIVNKLLKLKRSRIQRQNKNKIEHKTVPIPFMNYPNVLTNIQLNNQRNNLLTINQHPLSQCSTISKKWKNKTVQLSLKNQTHQDICILPFTNIRLDNSTQNSQSICEALSILKQYNMNNSEVLTESTSKWQNHVIKSNNFDEKSEKLFIETNKRINPTNKQNVPDKKINVKQNNIKKLISRSHKKDNPSNSLIYSKIKQFFPQKNTIEQDSSLDKTLG